MPIQIVDWNHAEENLEKVANAASPTDLALQTTWLETAKQALWDGLGVEGVV